MSKDYKDLLVALDIGTSKVVAIVAELKGEGQIGRASCRERVCMLV